MSEALAEYLHAAPEKITDLLTGKFDKDLEFHIIDKNLLNLHFYFINCREKKASGENRLYPVDCSQKSYMIVRLPQQHITEQGFSETPAAGARAEARLSGFSFLAFELWPRFGDESYEERCRKAVKNTDPIFAFSDEGFLNWNDPAKLRLITLIHWLKLKGTGGPAELEFVHKEDINKKNADPKILIDLPPNPTRLEPASEIYRNYRRRVTNLLKTKAPTKPAFVPVTMFEVPERTLLVPFFRPEIDAPTDVAEVSFLPNRLIEPSQNKYEIWSNRLAFGRSPTALKPDATQGEKEYQISGPCFRVIGVISEKELELPKFFEKCEEQCNSDAAENANASNFLPTLLDKTELAYLTQYANNTRQSEELDHRISDFDIREANGFFFTGLGVITHLKYYNVANRPIGLDLIEYEHIITQGRDIFIKVARLGYNTKTGQKYKHVIEGKRKFTDDANDTASFIELKQYCDCIDKEFSYFDKADDPWWDNHRYVPITDKPIPWNELTEPAFDLTAGSGSPPTPAREVKCHYRRLPFSRIDIVERERIPIKLLYKDVLQVGDQANPCAAQCTPWFWPIRETTRGTNVSDIPLEDYLPCEFNAVDKNGDRVNCSTPFMFIRASLLEAAQSNTDLGPLTEAYKDYLRGTVNMDGIADRDNQLSIDRRKIFLKKEKIGFTEVPPDSPTEEVSELQDKNVSKANVLETDFLDIYFRTRPSKDDLGNPQPAQKTNYILMPQMMRARVYVDHVRDLTQRAIPSVLEYHGDYIKHHFRTHASGKYANSAKSILTNTTAFIRGFEESANKTYDDIKGALQAAKDKLGNLVAPDIIPDTLSLEKFSITLPSDVRAAAERANAVIDAAGMITNISPYEILRGKMSEIMGGIDLREVLELLLPQEDIPLFNISKTLADISSEITNSPVFNEIKKDLEAIRNEINRLKAAYEKIAGDIRAAQESVNTKARELSQKIPNSDELDHLFNNHFETVKKEALEIILKDKFFNEVKGAIDAKEQEFRQLIERETAVLKFEVRAKAEEVKKAIEDVNRMTSTQIGRLEKIASELSKPEDQSAVRILLGLLYQLNNVEDPLGEAILDIEKKLREIVDPQSAGQAEANLKAQLDDLLLTIDDNEVFDLSAVPFLFLSEPVQFDPEYLKFQPAGTPGSKEFYLLADEAKAGFLQIENKVAALELFVTRNINGNDFQKRAANALQKYYLTPYRSLLDSRKAKVENLIALWTRRTKIIEDWCSQANRAYRKVAQILPDETNKALANILGLVEKSKPFIDVLRKFDPYFYYDEFGRIKKEILDIERRVGEDVFAAYSTELGQLQTTFASYKKTYEDYADLLRSAAPTSDAIKEQVRVLKGEAENVASQVRGKIEKIFSFDNQIKKLVNDIITLNSDLDVMKRTYEAQLAEYIKYTKEQAGAAADDLLKAVQRYIGLNQNDIEKVKQAQNLYQILTSIKQQDISYRWKTRRFRDLDLGFVGFRHFKNPDTELTVDVKATTHFAPGKFPPTIDKVTTFAENRLTNFGISFFDVITLWFLEATFVGGSETGTKFGVKIKDVQFAGALSFVQKLEEVLATAGIPLTLTIAPDHVALGYSLIIPSVMTPTFSFFDLSLNFDFRLYFDSRPLRFGFSLARRDRKFGIAAGIFAGFGFFGIVVEPRKGIVEIEIALEAGVWAGIRLGPISGEVKLAFGFYYRKNEFGVRLEGYIVAEGRLKVWVLEVSARIYLGIISDNGVVEGSCTVTYTVKLGFISKSFSGTFHRKIAGAESKNNNEAASIVTQRGIQLEQTLSPDPQRFVRPEGGALNRMISNVAATFDLNSEEHEETFPVDFAKWERFFTAF